MDITNVLCLYLYKMYLQDMQLKLSLPLNGLLKCTLLKHRTTKNSMFNFPMPNPDCYQQFNKRLLQSAKPLQEE